MIVLDKYVGETFLSRLYRDMHTLEQVEKSSLKSDNKYEKIRKYLNRLESIHNSVKDKNMLNVLKKYYYDKYVIKKENISDDYFDYLEENALNRGLGHIRYNKGILDREKDVIISDQKKSLDLWIDYFVSDDSKMYPMWFKYYVFQSVIKLGSFDKEKNIFNSRNENTVNIFPELNREAVGLMYDYFNKLLNDKKDYNLSDRELETLINGGSFRKIYAYIIKKLSLVDKNKTSANEGIWIKYDRGTDHIPLVKSLEGKGTGWCTAGEATAKEQLDGGDFYVYYSYDLEGNATVPRVAIRMEEDNIAEIRGIEKHQNIESEMEQVVLEKLKEFSDGNLYLKKVSDMDRLTKIYKKFKSGINDFDNDELRFLYQLDNKIEGFGYQDDPRIKEILNSRNKKKDLSKVLNCSMDKIILKDDYYMYPSVDTIKSGIVYYEGDIELEEVSQYTKLPKYISGDLVLNNKNLDEVELPLYVGGDVYLNYLEHIEHITLPKFIGGNIDLSGLKSVYNYTFPEIVYGALGLRNVVSMKNVVMPKNIYSYCKLSSLKEIEEVTMPNNVSGGLFIEGLEHASNLKFPDFVGAIFMGNLKEASNVIFPKKVSANFDLRSLKNILNVTFPEEVGGIYELTSLEDIKDLALPKKVSSLILSSLKSIDGLELPEIKDRLFLNGLETIEGLNLSEDFDLNKVFIDDNNLKQELISRQNKKL